MVLQRWQSVYLLLATILMGVYSFSTIAEIGIEAATVEIGMTGSNPEIGASMWGFFVVSALAAILALVTIFKFKTLKLQRRLCVIGGGITAALIISLMIYLFNVECDMLSISWSNILPVIAIIMFYLADLGISKDIKTLSSYDRIR